MKFLCWREFHCLAASHSFMQFHFYDMVRSIFFYPGKFGVRRVQFDDGGEVFQIEILRYQNLNGLGHRIFISFWRAVRSPCHLTAIKKTVPLYLAVIFCALTCFATSR